MYYPERGRELRFRSHHKHDQSSVKKCITPKGDENYHKKFHVITNFHVKKCITPKGDENL